MKEKVVLFLKSKLFITGVVVFIITAFLFSGNDPELIEENSVMKNTIQEQEEALEKLQEKTNSQEKSIEALNKKLKDPKIEKGMALLSKQEEVEELINAKNSEIQSKESKITELDKVIEQKQEIVRKKDSEPITVNAGQYFFGSDIPVGRYIASPLGRGSNFVVYGSDGRLEVNTILSRGEYTFFASEGAYLETAEKIKLIPVE